jgi:hypothetical protein
VATRGSSLVVKVGAGLAAFGLLAGLLVGVFVGVGGGTNDTTTTSAAPPSTSTTTTEAPLSDEDYLRFTAGISDLITAADAQRCPLVSAYTGFGELPDPANQAQVRFAVGLTLELLQASAFSAAADQPDVAATIASTADELQAEAEAAGYEPEWLNTPPGNLALADAGFQAAFAEYQQLTEELCLSEDPSGED